MEQASDNDFIRSSVSYRILRLAFACIMASFVFTASRKTVVSMGQTVKKAYAFSGCRKIFCAAHAACKGSLYLMSQLTFGILILSHFALDRIVYNRTQYGTIAVLALSMLTVYFLKKGLADNFSKVFRDSIAYSILTAKI